jgi:acyl carrier protein
MSARLSHLGRLRLVLADEVGADPARVTERAEFAALGVDSLAKAALVSRLEDEFAIRISDDEVAFCETVATALDLIETKIEAQVGTARFGRGVR